MSSATVAMERAPTPVGERVRADLIALIFQQVPLSALINALVDTLLAAVLWEVSPRELLRVWWLIVVSLSVARLTLAFSFQRRANDDDIRSWERRFVLTLILTGATWGFGGWVLMPHDSIAHQAVVFFFLMGMVGGAVANYSAHVRAVTGTSILIMLPATISFAIEDSLLTRAMAVGAVIYVVAAFRAASALAASLTRSYQLTHELAIARENAERQARTDELTGMRNRRAFYELGELAMSQAARYGNSASLIVLDIDRFKVINDTWGHATGDETLRLVALIIERTIRTSDIAGRIGGEEFAILLPRSGAAEARATAERLRVAMAQAPLWHDQGEIHFTASFGVAEPGPGVDSLDRLLAEADKALYEAKAQGRNRVVHRARG